MAKQFIGVSASSMARRASKIRASCALGVGLAAALLAGGCDSATLRGEARPTPPTRKAAYIFRNTPRAYEGITLQRDGTYRRVVIDKWGHAYEQNGTWRGYGGTIAASQQSRVDKKLELDGYSDPSDVIRSGSTRTAPQGTRSLSSSDFMR